MTEDEKKKLYEWYSKVEDYEPTEEEVEKMHSQKFNEWLKNL